MRIAIINMTGGGMSGGYQKYLRNVIPIMAAHPDVEAILCATPASNGVSDWFGPMPNVKFVDCKPFRVLFPHHDAVLLREMKRYSPDAIFVPVERQFHFENVPVVNMIQNMEPFTTNVEGNPFTEKVKNRIRFMDGERAIKKSVRVIAVSEFVRDFLVYNWNIPNKNIGLVYHGIDLPENNEGERPNLIPEEWRKRFLFTAGSIRPARGLEDAILAMKHLLSKNIEIKGLVIAGETELRMIAYQKKLKDWIQTHNLSSKVCWVGSLSEKEMTWCYKNCCIFLMTSRIESFGMIAGEAMAHGCICISADNPCLPEIFDDAAIYYLPKDGKALAEAIQSMFIWDNDQRKEASEKAKKRATEFSWEVCAEKTVEELAKAIKNK